MFRAVRQAWPAELPMSVRISAHDWVEGGITADDAVEKTNFERAAMLAQLDIK
ncbi:bifunctional hydroxylase/oxidoreductase [Bordetella pertussis]|nr:bifunctional hydroxylase/oxidoreductase [Bordetella pertussis]